jgi:TPR repeat protein
MPPAKVWHAMTSAAQSISIRKRSRVPEAAVNLGVLYLDGKWVPRDDPKAADWFHKAAEKGEPAAQTKLGIVYLLGRGVGHDDNEAAKWLRKAADQNFAPAMNLLEKLYATGRGVERIR